LPAKGATLPDRARRLRGPSGPPGRHEGRTARARWWSGCSWPIARARSCRNEAGRRWPESRAAGRLVTSRYRGLARGNAINATAVPYRGARTARGNPSGALPDGAAGAGRGRGM